MRGSPRAAGFGPQLFRLHLDTGDGVDDDDGGFNDAQRRAGIGQEVGEARRVDEVDFGLLPFGVGEAGGEGVLAGDFFVVEVGDGGALVDPADAIDGAGGEEQGRHQLRLAASAMSDDSHVADAGGVVDLHRGIPPAPRGFPRGGVSRPGGKPMGSASAPARDGRKTDHSQGRRGSQGARRGACGQGRRAPNGYKYVSRISLTDNNVCWSASVRGASRAPHFHRARSDLNSIRHLCQRFARYRQVCLRSSQSDSAADPRFSSKTRQFRRGASRRKWRSSCSRRHNRG